jgi:ankyrin repeat protein
MLVAMVLGLCLGGCDDGTCTALASAARAGDVAGIESLLASGASMECRDRAGWTALHVAASHGRSASVVALLDRGADIDARGERQRTPLYQAA